VNVGCGCKKKVKGISSQKNHSKPVIFVAPRPNKDRPNLAHSLQCTAQNRGPGPSAVAPCALNKNRAYGHGVGMSLFCLGCLNIPSCLQLKIFNLSVP